MNWACWLVSWPVGISGHCGKWYHARQPRRVIRATDVSEGHDARGWLAAWLLLFTAG
ncbi:hypothetical protein KCP76_24730 [Salmonella enterica subsp. enterica serovar Weltevreden]|nr:hypothetical protein KCP76_24730 [Salmonella enterica subsp. enterica serovar Weltevreden]